MDQVNIEIDADGSFIIDPLGIRSTEPIPEVSEKWDPITGTLKLEGPSSYGCNSSISISGNKIFLGGSASTVIINGKVINTNSFSNDPQDMKMYSCSWSKFKFEKTPSLSGLCVKGSANCKVSIKLAKSCDFLVSGSGSVYASEVKGSRINAIVSGSGSIKGYGSVAKMTTIVSGSGSIKGFSITKKATALVSGSGSVSLSKLEGCIVKKMISGSGDVSID